MFLEAGTSSKLFMDPVVTDPLVFVAEDFKFLREAETAAFLLVRTSVFGLV